MAIVRRPEPGAVDAAAEAWRTAGIDHVISLLEDHEAHELGIEAEAHACRTLGLSFTGFPIADRGVPDSQLKMRRLAEEAADRIRDGESVAVHCRAGIGRSGLAAAAILCLLGHGPDEAFERIRAARRVTVPDTDEQRRWVEVFASDLKTAAPDPASLFRG